MKEDKENNKYVYLVVLSDNGLELVEDISAEMEFLNEEGDLAARLAGVSIIETKAARVLLQKIYYINLYCLYNNQNNCCFYSQRSERPIEKKEFENPELQKLIKEKGVKWC